MLETGVVLVKDEKKFKHTNQGYRWEITETLRKQEFLFSCMEIKTSKRMIWLKCSTLPMLIIAFLKVNRSNLFD